jgi:hypothetical protein
MRASSPLFRRLTYGQTRRTQTFHHLNIGKLGNLMIRAQHYMRNMIAFYHTGTAGQGFGSRSQGRRMNAFLDESKNDLLEAITRLAELWFLG